MKASYRGHGGSDLSVVNAARVSFNNTSDWEIVERQAEDLPFNRDHNGDLAWEKVKQLKPKDVNLIQYLARGMPRSEWNKVINEICETGMTAMLGEGREAKDAAYNAVQWQIEDLMLMAQHWVPFTHTMITLHMIAPVPIARQLFKHKIGFTESEESRRYVSDAVDLYIPKEFREKAVDIKQGSGTTHPASDYWVERYTRACKLSIAVYEDMIEDGIAPEQARFVLPQGVQVQWIWTGNLASFARFYNQRSDSHAQLESQELAKQVGDIIRPLYPVSWDALVKSGRRE